MSPVLISLGVAATERPQGPPETGVPRGPRSRIPVPHAQRRSSRPCRQQLALVGPLPHSAMQTTELPDAGLLGNDECSQLLGAPARWW